MLIRRLQISCRSKLQVVVTGGPPRDADLPGATLVTCAVSACAMEVDVTELVRDEYFTAVLSALEQQVLLHMHPSAPLLYMGDLCRLIRGAKNCTGWPSRAY